MMKVRLLLIFLLAGTCVFANEHGVLEDYVESLSGKSDKHYLMEKILSSDRRQPFYLKVAIDALNSNSEEIESYQNLITENYNKWFSLTADAIYKSKRAREFADILPLLMREIHVTFIKPYDTPDVSIMFWPKEKVQEVCNASACEDFAPDGGHIIYISTEKQQNDPQGNTLLHEIGHSLGFSDQYLPIGGQTGRNNADFVYSTPKSQPSVMREPEKGFQCGDVDGMINLIDITRGQFHGGSDGWRSFCKRPKYRYVRGKAEVKPYEIRRKGPAEFELVDNTQGGQTRHLSPVFEAYSPFGTHFEVKKRDKQKRELYAVGPNGEEKFCMYIYEKAMCIVTRGNEYLSLERWAYAKEKRSKLGRNKNQLDHRFILFMTGVKTGIGVVGVNCFGNYRMVKYVTDEREILMRVSASAKKRKGFDVLIDDIKTASSGEDSQKRADRAAPSLVEQVSRQVEKAKPDKLKEVLLTVALEN